MAVSVPDCMNPLMPSWRSRRGAARPNGDWLRHSHESHRIRFVRTGVYRRLDAELTHEIMDAMALGLHDRLVAPYSLAGSEEFGQ